MTKIPGAEDIPYCGLHLSPTRSKMAVLGDSFLRSAYVVYDLDNKVIALAQSNNTATPSGVDSDIREITAAGGIAGAMKSN